MLCSVSGKGASLCGFESNICDVVSVSIVYIAGKIKAARDGCFFELKRLADQ